jgi:hypothetical protein
MDKKACLKGCCVGPAWLGPLVVLVIGVLFLLRDLNVWDFWNISWWTAVFVLMGLCGLLGTCMGKKK